MISNQPTDRVRLPYHLYEEFAQRTCCSQLCEFFMKDDCETRFFSTDPHAFCHDGKVYLPTGRIHSCLEQQALLCHRLMPAADWPGQQRSRPGQSGRKYYEGVRVSYRKQTFVIGPEVRFDSYLPVTVSQVSMPEAKDFHRENSKYGWRANYSEPTWESIEGAVVATYGHTGDEILHVHYLNSDGVVDEISIRNLNALTQYTDPSSGTFIMPESQLTLF